MDEAKEEEEFLILLLKLILDFNNVKLLEKMMKIDGYKLSIIIRGRYFKNVAFRDHEKSRVFVKVTKTKVLAAYGQLIDVLFGANKFPLTIQETRVPEGIDEYAHLNPLKEQMGMNENEQPTPGIEGNMDYTPGEHL